VRRGPRTGRRGPAADPFGERTAPAGRRRHVLLGTAFTFEASDARLLALVDAAYAGLPRQRVAGAGRAARIRLLGTADDPNAAWRTPPPPRTLSGGGLLCGAIDAANFAAVSPGTASALVALSPRLRRAAYHARYELLEFAVFTLGMRLRSLVPLHAACIGRGGRALLLVGDSGAGKSTLALHALLAGFEFTSEDSAFVWPDRLRVTGIGNFLHLRRDAPAGVDDPRLRRSLARAPLIRRRSGTAKLELDVRRARLPLAPSPSRIAGIVFLSAARAGAGPLLRPLARKAALARLTSAHPFASALPAWPALLRQAAALPFAELRRGASPAAGVSALASLLARVRR